MAQQLQAVVVVVLEDGRFLLIRRGATVPDAGFWAPVSGNIGVGESHEAAVVREAREELGIDVRPIRKVWESVSWRGSHQLHWWLATRVAGHLRPNSREVAEVRWCTVDEYFQLEGTFPNDHEFFKSVMPAVYELVRRTS